MDEFDDLNTYNGDPVHGGWVDYSYHQNTGELSDFFDDEEDY